MFAFRGQFTDLHNYNIQMNSLLSSEINLIWSVHQLHHSSQEFNVTVGLRLPALNRFVAMVSDISLQQQEYSLHSQSVVTSIINVRKRFLKKTS